MATKQEPPNPADPEFSYEVSLHLFLFTSLTAGSSHIISATSRMETILKANRIPYYAIDTATDEKARRIWTRRSKGRTIPGLVKQGMILGDLEQVEEWNEFGEIKDVLGVKKKKKKTDPGASSTTKTVSNENDSPKELKTGEAPPAPELPKDESKDLPIRTKQPDTTSPSAGPAREEPAKPGGQSNLAAEVAAAAQRRTKDKAAALKASVEAKQKETQKSGESAEEKGGTPERGPVAEVLDAAPADRQTDAGESRAGGTEALTDDPQSLQKQEEELKHVEKKTENRQADGEAESSVVASKTSRGRQPIDPSSDTAPAEKSVEEAVADAPPSLNEKLVNADAADVVNASSTKSGKDSVDGTLDATLATTTDEKAGTSALESPDEKTADTEAIHTAKASSPKPEKGPEPEKGPVDSSLDAAPAAKSGEAAATSQGHNKATSPGTEAVSVEAAESAGAEAEHTAQQRGGHVTRLAEEHTVRKMESEKMVSEEQGDSITTSSKELKEEAVDGDKASESVED